MSSSISPIIPRPTVGTVVFHQGKVLLVKRGKAPNLGKWAIPGGKIELGETIAETAERELLEETGVSAKAGEIIKVFDAIEREGEQVTFHYVVVDVIGEYLGGEPKGGDDVADARWLSPEEVVALDVNATTLELLQEQGFI